jgi:hypothetical protein
LNVRIAPATLALTYEPLVSVGVAWGIGQSGAPAVGADEPNTIQPGIFFGKGFGDLPDWLAWARPLLHRESAPPR